MKTNNVQLLRNPNIQPSRDVIAEALNEEVKQMIVKSKQKYIRNIVGVILA